ncbi:ABC transporter ATP-binding protein [Pseudochryseolinea flava]|nr:ABC transporter ATP-binding protein [Pseudochryseolinea flava]
MKPILEIQNIGKRFTIGHEQGPYLSFRDKITDLFKASKSKKENFWALDDVSFDVQPGEAVGIIGRNGAGKSTLLKVLSKITPPTRGRIISRGRMASLLEVGTGFHQELTGRENIFLNGSILGMRKKEIVSKFDEIVDFSGVEQFLDTPLKHYSSGMQLRLAFAVAAFLEPEILIIDEVLAVGDAEFQKKCMGKMNEVNKAEGRTILLVSHDMAAITNICSRAILLEKGNIKMQGSASDVVQQYLLQASKYTSSGIISAENASGTKAVKFTEIKLFQSENAEKRYVNSIATSGNVGFEVTLENDLPHHVKTYIAITVFDNRGNKLFTLDNLYTNQPLTLHTGRQTVVCVLQDLPLLPSHYFVNLWCSDGYETFHTVENAFKFEVEKSDVFQTGKIHNINQHGFFFVRNEWSAVN